MLAINPSMSKPVVGTTVHENILLDHEKKKLRWLFLAHFFWTVNYKMGGKQVHLATRVDASKLLQSPETVMQQMSIKIFQRREELIAELVGTRIHYDTGNGSTRCAVVERAEDSNLIVRDGPNKIRVPVRRVNFDQSSSVR